MGCRRYAFLVGRTITQGHEGITAEAFYIAQASLPHCGIPRYRGDVFGPIIISRSRNSTSSYILVYSKYMSYYHDKPNSPVELGRDMATYIYALVAVSLSL